MPCVCTSASYRRRSSSARFEEALTWFMGACREARSSFGCSEEHLMVCLRFQALENVLAEKSPYSCGHSDPGRNHMLHGNRIGLSLWSEHHPSRCCAENGKVEKINDEQNNDGKSKDGRECHKYKVPLDPYRPVTSTGAVRMGSKARYPSASARLCARLGWIKGPKEMALETTLRPEEPVACFRHRCARVAALPFPTASGDRREGHGSRGASHR